MSASERLSEISGLERIMRIAAELPGSSPAKRNIEVSAGRRLARLFREVPPEETR